MIPVLAGLLFAIPVIGPDTSPSLTRTKEQSRRYECTWLDAAEARRQLPGRTRPARVRDDYSEDQVAICSELLLRPDLRAPLDRAVLHDLRSTTADLASSAAAVRPDLADRTWLVETYYPNSQVSPKIGFATKAALMSGGLRVSDRTPILGAGDVDVLTRMPPTAAYPAACARYTATGSLRPGDALLAIVHRDPRETVLHAGICADGRWMWLR